MGISNLKEKFHLTKVCPRENSLICRARNFIASQQDKLSLFQGSLTLAYTLRADQIWFKGPTERYPALHGLQPPAELQILPSRRLQRAKHLQFLRDTHQHSTTWLGMVLSPRLPCLSLLSFLSRGTIPRCLSKCLGFTIPTLFRINKTFWTPLKIKSFLKIWKTFRVHKRNLSTFRGRRNQPRRLGSRLEAASETAASTATAETHLKACQATSWEI